MDTIDQMFEFMQNVNLNLNAQFHNHVDRTLRREANEIESMEDLTPGDKTYWKANFTEHFPKKLRETTFLLIFAHLEEMLHLMSKSESFNASKIKVSLGNGITKYKPYIKSLLKDELSTSDDYRLIRESQLVRNSILHIAGRVSLSRDQTKLKQLLKSRPKYFQIDKDRIHITIEGLAAFQSAVRNLTKTLLIKSNSVEQNQN